MMQNSVKCNFFNEELENFVFNQPTKFVMEGKTKSAETWVELIDKLCVMLIKKDAGKMQEFLKEEKKRKNRIPYLSNTEQSIHFVKYLTESGLYLNQKIDAPCSVKLIRKLLDKFAIQEDSFCLYRTDY